MTARPAAETLDWERIFDAHYRSLYRALVGATGSADGVDDAIQDAFSSVPACVSSRSRRLSPSP